MYATRLAPSVPIGIGGSCAVKRVATLGTTYKTTRFGLYFYLVSCLIAGFVIALCLDHMFELTQDGNRTTTELFNPTAPLDTSLFNDLRAKEVAP